MRSHHSQLRGARVRPLRAGIAAVIAAVIAVPLSLASAGSAQAVIGSPTIAQTPAGVTSVPPTQGKAQGSGLWGYAGDLVSKTSDMGTVSTYGVTASPDGSIWVSDSAKIFYNSGGLLAMFAYRTYCALPGAVFSNTNINDSTSCLLGHSVLVKHTLDDPSFTGGQYQADGTYAARTPGVNAGIGSAYSELADSWKTDGSDLASGRFGGLRGLAALSTGEIWAADPDSGSPYAVNQRKSGLKFAADGTELAAIGNAYPNAPAGWADRYAPFAMGYSVGVARLLNDHIVVTAQGGDMLKEYDASGAFVRNIALDVPAGTGWTGDLGYRDPYAVATDPVTGDLLVGYVALGTRSVTTIDRFDLSACTTAPASPPAGSSADTCSVPAKIGGGKLPSNTVINAIGVDPLTRDVYVSAGDTQLYIYGADGAYKGRMAYGSGAKDGQQALVRGITFDKNGFMYVTVSELTDATRVEIYARTPDPITGLAGVYTDQTRTAATLSWSALPTGVTADGQSPLKDYVVEQSTDGGTTWSVVPTPVGTTPSATVSGLDPAKTYQFRLSAWNEAGNGDVAVTSLTMPVPSTISIVKTGAGVVAPTSDQRASVAAGTVTFDYTVTNNGPSVVTGIAVTDSVIGDVTDVVSPSGFDGTLAAGASVTLRATGVVPAGNYSNTATATGTSVGTPVTASTQWFGFGSAPAVSVVKSGDGVTAPTRAEAHHVAAGTTVTFTYLVTNTGNVPLAISTVHDDMIGDIAAPATFAGTLEPGASVTFTTSAPIAAGDYKNVVTVSGAAGETKVEAEDAWYGVGDAVVTTSPAPSTTAPTAKPLASTGTDVPFGALVGGVLLMGAGIGVSLLRIRRARS